MRDVAWKWKMEWPRGTPSLPHFPASRLPHFPTSRLPAFPASLLLLTLAILLAGCSLGSREPDRSLAGVQESGVLLVGIDPSYPPFASVDVQGQIVGYDVELAARLADYLQVQVRFVPIDVGTIFDGLLARKFDVIVSAIPLYPELTRDIAFSEPYFNAGQVILVSEWSEVHGPADLAGSTVGAEMGSAAEVEARALAKLSTGLALKTYVSPQVVLEQLGEGAIDAALVDRVTALEHLARNPGLRQAGEPLTFEPYVIAVRRRDSALLQAVNTAILDMQKGGFLARLEEKWMAEDG